MSFGPIKGLLDVARFPAGGRGLRAQLHLFINNQPGRAGVLRVQARLQEIGQAIADESQTSSDPCIAVVEPDEWKLWVLCRSDDELQARQDLLKRHATQRGVILV